MITWLFGFLYGIGFSLTLVCGFVWMGLVRTFHGSLHPIKVLTMAMAWPITVIVVGSKIHSYLRDEEDYES